VSEYIKIETLLVQSIADFRLSQDEQYSFRNLLESLANKDELLAYARNKAFDVYRKQGLSDTDSFYAGLKWLEKIIKTIDSVRSVISASEPKAYFSPGDSCAKQIIHCIQSAKEFIDICVFTISDNKISDAILAAFENGVKIRIISDNCKAEDQGSDVYELARKGVPVRLDKSPYHMHHKFAIFDQSTLINGSFNWTRSASTVNEENITVLYDANLISDFSENFESLWDAAEAIQSL
jgi:phosphatidylserine/phosphatidylglycerophosphate/cardiolipin synthase-like enzyme